MFTTYKLRLCKNWLMNWTIDKCHIIFFLNKKIHALKYGKIDWELVDCSSRQSLHYLFKKKHKRRIIPLKKRILLYMGNCIAKRPGKWFDNGFNDGSPIINMFSLSCFLNYNCSNVSNVFFIRIFFYRYYSSPVT